MNTSPEKYIDRLQEVSAKKLALLQDMLLLTMAQAESITEDSVENLEQLIRGKQDKIDAIDKLDEEFSVYFARLKQELGVTSLDELQTKGIKGVKELKETIGQVMELIREISGVEKQNNDKANHLLDELGGEIRKLQQGKKMNSVYNPGPSMPPPSYFIDKKK
jgi:hypothetical protein